jgi:hypothetical protein
MEIKDNQSKLSTAMLTRRGFISLTALSTLALVGCGSESSSTDDEESSSSDTADTPEEEQPTEAAVGDVVAVSTEYGDVNVTIDGFETSQSMTDDFRSYGEITDSEVVGVLMLVLENVSFDDGYNEGFVALDEVFRVEDPDGISVSYMNSGYDYGQYKCAAGAFAECAIGETARFAIMYAMSPSITQVTVVFPDVNTTVPVSVGQA